MTGPPIESWSTENWRAPPLIVEVQSNCPGRHCRSMDALRGAPVLAAFLRPPSVSAVVLEEVCEGGKSGSPRAWPTLLYYSIA